MKNDAQFEDRNEMDNEVETIRELIKQVIDPELGVNIVDLGLVYDIQKTSDKTHIRMTLTTPGCPMHDTIVGGVKYVLRDLDEVEVDVVWDPPWNPNMITDDGKEMLGYF